MWYKNVGGKKKICSIDINGYIHTLQICYKSRENIQVHPAVYAMTRIASEEIDEVMRSHATWNKLQIEALQLRYCIFVRFPSRWVVDVRGCAGWWLFWGGRRGGSRNYTVFSSDLCCDVSDEFSQQLTEQTLNRFDNPDDVTFHP